MAHMLYEDKPFEETSGKHSTLNPNSYAAQAAFSYAAWSVEALHEQGYKLTGSAVTEMARTLAAIVATVQSELTGRTSFQDGLNTRLRGALKTAMETERCPIGDPAEAITAWTERITQRVRNIAKVAIGLWDAGEPVMPEFSALTTAKKTDPWRATTAAA